MLAGTLGLAVLLSLLAIKGPRAVRTAFVLAAAVSGLSTVAMAAVVLSNGARKAEEMAVIGRAVLDLPASSRRLEDGAVFVPKPTQRLLGIATVESAKAATVQKTVR